MALATSIVIPVYNGLDFLKKNLKQITDLNANEVIVVDDASTDESASFISTHFPKIKLLRNSQNQGFTKSVNAGLASASGDIVFLLNQDVTPAPDLIKNSLKIFSDPSVFAVSFNENDSEYSYSTVAWKDGFLHYSSGPKVDAPHASAWASGGSAAFRKDIWDKLGGFNPIFSPGYYEDLELGLRAKAHGHTILWDPASKVEHARETSFKKEYTPKRLQHIKDRNYLLVQWMYLPKDQKLPHLFSLTKKLLTHPGFAIPVFQALVRWINRESQ